MDIENFIIYLNSKGLSPRTMKEYAYYLRKFHGDSPDLQLEINRFLSENNNNMARAFLRNLLDFLKRTDIDIPKYTRTKPKKVIHPLSIKEFNLLLEEIYSRDEIYGKMTELMFITGIRLDELLRIKAGDFRLKEWAENIELPCHLKIHGKGSKERIVLVPKETMMRVFKLIETLDDDMILFGVKSRMGYWKMLRRCSIKVLGRSVHPHLLRHSRAKFWRKRKIDIMNIKNILGHSSILTTQLYVNPSEEETLEVIEEDLLKE